MTKARELPHNLEAEQFVIGSSLISEQCARTAAELLKPEDFYTAQHRTIWGALESVISGNTTPDIVTVYEAGGGKIEASYLSSLTTDAMPGVAFVKQRAAVIKKHSTLRSLFETLSTGARWAMEPGADPERITEDLGALFLKRHAQKGKARALKQSVGPVVKSVLDGPDPGVLTGFFSIDGVLRGMRAGELIILAARTSMGKTSLAGNIFMEAAKCGHTVLFFSLEMMESEIILRLLAAVAEINLQALKIGQLEDYQLRRLETARAMLETLPILIDDQAGLSIQQLASRARAVAIREPVGLIVVDYLQLLGGKGENQTQRISAVSGGLKQLSKDLNVPVLALSQLNRTSEADSEPKLHHLRDSGAIEQDADVVLLLHRFKGGSDSPLQNRACVNVAKHRNGPTGKIDLQFEGHFCRFKEL